MAYDLPVPADVKVRFKEFATVADGDISPLIQYAADLWVDPAMWSERDYTKAIVYLAAHYLRLSQAAQLANPGTADPGGGGSGGDTPLQTYLSTISIGDRTVSWRAPTQRGNISNVGSSDVTTADEFLRRSYYGMLFLQLRRRNIVPVVVI